jgi:hypothetical protein
VHWCLQVSALTPCGHHSLITIMGGPSRLGCLHSTKDVWRNVGQPRHFLVHGSTDNNLNVAQVLGGQAITSISLRVDRIKMHALCLATSRTVSAPVNTCLVVYRDPSMKASMQERLQVPWVLGTCIQHTAFPCHRTPYACTQNIILTPHGHLLGLSGNSWYAQIVKPSWVNTPSASCHSRQGH